MQQSLKLATCYGIRMERKIEFDRIIVNYLIFIIQVLYPLQQLLLFLLKSLDSNIYRFGTTFVFQIG